MKFISLKIRVHVKCFIVCESCKELNVSFLRYGKVGNNNDKLDNNLLDSLAHRRKHRKEISLTFESRK